MSYEEQQPIGLGISEEYPKGSAESLSETEKDLLARMGVDPAFINLEEMLLGVEPEPKLLMPTPECLMQPREFFSSAENSFLIDGQMYEGKNPLVSKLIDTVNNGFATARLAEQDLSLRFRYELDPETGKMTQGDFNEKTSIRSSKVIGGCADRSEREAEIPSIDDIEGGYYHFIEECENKGTPSSCANIPFDQLKCFAGYITARTQYGFAVRHPDYSVLFVFEACEDNTITLRGDMKTQTSKFYEFEFEPKQVWGTLPEFAQSPEGFKEFLYSSMNKICKSINAAIDGSVENQRSKAEQARDALKAVHRSEYLDLKRSGELSKMYNRQTLTGFFKEYTPEKQELSISKNLLETIESAKDVILAKVRELHKERLMQNHGAAQPDPSMIGQGQGYIWLPPSNDNKDRHISLQPTQILS